MNTEIAQLGDDGMFATLVYCIYDLESRTLVFTNAGHCVPLLRRFSPPLGGLGVVYWNSVTLGQHEPKA